MFVSMHHSIARELIMRSTQTEGSYNGHIFNEEYQLWLVRWSGSLVTVEARSEALVIARIESEYGSPVDQWDFYKTSAGTCKAIRKKLAK